MGKIKLDLLNDRFYRPGDVVEPRIFDSTEEMVWKAPERDSRDTQIPFLMKPKIIRSSYSDWRTGKIKLESGDARQRHLSTGIRTRLAAGPCKKS